MNKNKKIHWLGVFIYLIFQVFALFFMRGLEHRNMETLFFSGKGLKDYRQFLNTFKEQKTILVKTNFPKGLTEAGYQDFETALRNLREKFPEVEVLGFFDVYKLAVKKDELSSVQEFIRNKPDLHLKFVGPDYLVFLSVFKEDVSPKEIQSFISQLQAQPFFSGQKVQIAGLPYINYLLDQYSGDIKTKLFPILFAVVFLATLLFTRDFLSSLILFIPALGSLSLTLAFTRQIYSSMNMVTSIVPLLIFVLNLSLAFHFYFAFLEYGSMRRALREKKIPFLLMVSTTAIGFGSLALSDIPAIREFGVLSFLSILLSSGLTFLWAYSLFPWRIEKEPKNLLAWVPASLFYNTWSRRIIVLLSLLLIPSSIWFFPKIPLNTDATSYFPKKSGLQENIRAVERELLGIPIAEVELLKKDRGEIDYDDLLILDKLENEILRDLEGHGGIISANQVIEEANYLYTGEKKLPPFELSYDTLKSQTLPVFQRQYPVQQR
ncbi:MAG: hypothetical protein K8R69_05630, partial [Deltaproteobacteria bacterium]|nr:hypothetical protein [Deltaproteobacteria bacterium]